MNFLLIMRRLLPVDLEYGLWPTSGEIDIMESRGNLDYSEGGVQIGAEQVGCTLHYGMHTTAALTLSYINL